MTARILYPERQFFLADVGERIAVERHRKGLTQGQLADRCGLPKNVVKSAEDGRSIPFWVAKQLARALEVTLDSLAEGTE